LWVQSSSMKQVPPVVRKVGRQTQQGSGWARGVDVGCRGNRLVVKSARHRRRNFARPAWPGARACASRSSRDATFFAHARSGWRTAPRPGRHPAHAPQPLSHQGFGRNYRASRPLRSYKGEHECNNFASPGSSGFMTPAGAARDKAKTPVRPAQQGIEQTKGASLLDSPLRATRAPMFRTESILYEQRMCGAPQPTRTLAVTAKMQSWHGSRFMYDKARRPTATASNERRLAVQQRPTRANGAGCGLSR
jgi:hypothetical protein